MMRSLMFTLVSSFLFVGAAQADVGQDWIDAMRKNKAKVAAKVSVEANFKLGAVGKSTVVATKVDRLFKKIFRGLKKTFKEGDTAVVECTALGRELGYFAMEWKERDETVAQWIRDIPEQFCTGEGLHPPKFHLVKVVGGELPHALIVIVQGEDPKVIGAYHF